MNISLTSAAHSAPRVNSRAAAAAAKETPSEPVDTLQTSRPIEEGFFAGFTPSQRNEIVGGTVIYGGIGAVMGALPAAGTMANLALGLYDGSKKAGLITGGLALTNFAATFAVASGAPASVMLLPAAVTGLYWGYQGMLDTAAELGRG